MGNKNKPNIVVVLGATGTGKQSVVLWQIARCRRFVVVSPKEPWDDYAGKLGAPLVTMQNLRKHMQSKRARAVVQVPIDGNKPHIAAILTLALSLGDCGVVIEEAHTALEAGKCPRIWSRVCSMGRAAGVGGGDFPVVVCSTRPAWLDRSPLANAAKIIIGRLPADGKNEVLKGLFGEQAINGLRGFDKLECDVRTGIVTPWKGKIFGGEGGDKNGDGKTKKATRAHEKMRGGLE